LFVAQPDIIWRRILFRWGQVPMANHQTIAHLNFGFPIIQTKTIWDNVRPPTQSDPTQ
jgi:hypothetical protein